MDKFFLSALLIVAGVIGVSAIPADNIGTSAVPDTASSFETISQDSLSWKWNQTPKPTPLPVTKKPPGKVTPPSEPINLPPSSGGR